MGNSNGVENPPVHLPQNDPDQVNIRTPGLEAAIAKYDLEQMTFGLTDSHQRLVDVVNLPPMLREIPKEEKMSWYYFFRFGLQFLKFSVYSLYQRLLGVIFGPKWTIAQMIHYFGQPHPWILQEPQGCKVWRETAIDDPHQTPWQRKQADHWFAWQRLNGVTRNLIRRVNAVPPRGLIKIKRVLGVRHRRTKCLINLLFGPFISDIENNHPYLEGNSLQFLAQNKRLYVVDLSEVSLKDDLLLAPVALFMIFHTMLMPVAVVTNLRNGDQVYTPVTEAPFDADRYRLRKWVQMRMTFNMLEAQYHESITHLGFTHLLMDGVSVCMHRTLSDRHPIYKLLLPHFQFMHAINKTAKDKLLQHGGYVEKDMYIGRISMLKLISKHNKIWKYNPIQTNFQNRAVMGIPGYYFRDDATLLDEAIRTFVNDYVTHYYNNDATVVVDNEIQQFRKELILGRAMNQQNGQINVEKGCGMEGLPEFNNIQNLVDVLTHFIYTCSVEHSATNFPQYEQYAFPPNFAAVLHGQPEQAMNNLDDCMPTRRETFSTIKIMKVLTLSLTNSLGNYDKKYLLAMDVQGRSLVKKFQDSLAEIQTQINQRNTNIVEENRRKARTGNNENLHKYPYEWLLPKNVLNSISI